MIIRRIALGLTSALALAGGAQAAVIVSSASGLPTKIADLTVGQTYTVKATGNSDLCASCNKGGPLLVTADGVPLDVAGGAYASMAPSGLDHDPTSGPTSFGIGGAGKLMGALLGSFTATPTQSDYFTLGSSYTFTAQAGQTALYGVVNDSYYPDNPSTGFSVSLANGVPEPAVWSMMLLGFLGAGAMLRRERETRRATA